MDIFQKIAKEAGWELVEEDLTSEGYLQWKIDLMDFDKDNSPEWFKEISRNLTKEEIFEELKRVKDILKEAEAHLNETPDLTKYSEIIYPPQKLKGFEKFKKEGEVNAE